MGFSSNFDLQNYEKNDSRLGKTYKSNKIAFRSWYRFSMIFGDNVPPFPLPRSIKIASKPHLGRHRCFDQSWHRSFNDLNSMLETNLAPCWPLFPSKCGSAVARSPLFCWVYVLLPFFGQPGPLLAPFGLDFGGTGLDFEGFLGAIFFILVKCWTSFFQLP